MRCGATTPNPREGPPAKRSTSSPRRRSPGQRHRRGHARRPADGGGYVIASSQNVAQPQRVVLQRLRAQRGQRFREHLPSRQRDVLRRLRPDRRDHGVTANLGSAFPNGMFVCQDNNNDLPGASRQPGHEDRQAGERRGPRRRRPPPPPPPPDPSPIAFVGKSTVNGSSTTFTTTIPAATRAGDALLLFASHDSTVSLTGPGSGWTQVSTTLVDNSLASTVWRRTAITGDAGTTVRLTRTTATKAAVTLAAYTGVDTTSPIAAVSRAGEPGSTASHTTPLVSNSTSGSWRVSYWTDKNQATTTLDRPVDGDHACHHDRNRHSSVRTLLTDPEVALTASTPAQHRRLHRYRQRRATATAMWTILLRPAANAPPSTPRRSLGSPRAAQI